MSPVVFAARVMIPCLFIACFIACAGCFPLPDRNLQRKVGEAELVGTWKMTGQSLQLLQRDGFASDPSHAYTITFDADGTLAFHSVLDDFSSGVYHDITGTWTLEHDTTGASNVPKANALKLKLDTGPNHTTIRYLNFDEENDTLILWSFYGDPDSWQFIEYEPVTTGGNSANPTPAVQTRQ